MSRVTPSMIVAFIDSIANGAAKREDCRLGIDYVSAMAGTIRLCDQLDSEYLQIGGQDYTDYVESVEGLRQAIETWRSRGQVDARERNERGAFIYLLRSVLEKCPDSVPSPATAELSFIQDAALRDSIRVDLSTASSALHNGEWKAATVLAGAASEALLLWAIQHKASSGALAALNKKPQKPIDKWGLKDYIDVAHDLSIIKGQTASQAHLARDFRNLIHPGAAQRTGQECTRATALAALASVEFIVEDIG